eukprot:752542-Hanusia_phi.AAC.4
MSAAAPPRPLLSPRLANSSPLRPSVPPLPCCSCSACPTSPVHHGEAFLVDVESVVGDGQLGDEDVEEANRYASVRGLVSDDAEGGGRRGKGGEQEIEEEATAEGWR